MEKKTHLLNRDRLSKDVSRILPSHLVQTTLHDGIEWTELQLVDPLGLSQLEREGGGESNLTCQVMVASSDARHQNRVQSYSCLSTVN